MTQTVPATPTDPASPPAGEGDFARMEVETPFDADALKAFIDDPERLLRINPLMEFQRFEREGEERWHLQGRNLANGREFDVHFERNPLPGGGWRLRWQGWLKQATELRIRPGADGTARLEIVDDYSGVSEEERRARIEEVDTSFMHWGQALHRYLRNQRRWHWVPGWRWYMNGPWLRMKPSARRIAFLLVFITAAEFLLFLFVLLIFRLETA